ncbi:MAG: helix-turn-helix transcriptional regulator [Candidatus Aminicenantales bacterium]
MPSPIKIGRFLQGFSQKKLAEKVGVSQGTVSRLEAGQAPDTPKNREARAKIAELLNVPESLLTLGDRS